MSSIDSHHLERMLDSIGAMREGLLTLTSGADNLLFLCDSLEVEDRAWAAEFTSHVATLESAGLASPEQVAEMGTRLDSVVTETLDALEAIIRSRLRDVCRSDDDGA